MAIKRLSSDQWFWVGLIVVLWLLALFTGGFTLLIAALATPIFIINARNGY